MKVIFLDFDGVLINREALTSLRKLKRGMEGRPSQPYAAHPDCVAAVNRIVAEVPDVKAVISSTWRLDHSLNELRALLACWGVLLPVIGKTPRLIEQEEGHAIGIAQPRGVEIQDWLTNHPGVTSFVILDDDADMEHLAPRLIKTEFEFGLTMSHAERAIAMLSEAAA